MNTQTSDNLFLEIGAKPEMVAHARHEVADYTRRQCWNNDDVDALTLAVGEACSNAVNYGGKGCDAAVVWVSCTKIAPDRLQVDIKNQGNSFHPDLAKLSVMPDAEGLATRGRGFALMYALVDDVQVLSDGANTTIRLTKSKSPESLCASLSGV